MIGIQRLEGFYWVAKTGGYASAARAFPYPISQPGVHQQVKRLEEELGLTLLDSTGKSQLILTPAGKRLFDFVGPFFEGLGPVVRSLQADELRGELRIAAPSMYVQNLLPSWIGRIRERSSDIQVLTEEIPWNSVDRLRQGAVDLLVDYLPVVPDDLAAKHVATLRPCLAVPKVGPWAGKESLAPESMKAETFIAYQPGYLRDLQDQGLEQLGIVPPQIITASTGSAILGFISEGLGYSLLGLGEESGAPVGVAVHPIREPKIEYKVWAIWRKDMPENPLLDVALESAPQP